MHSYEAACPQCFDKYKGNLAAVEASNTHSQLGDSLFYQLFLNLEGCRWLPRSLPSEVPTCLFTLYQVQERIYLSTSMYAETSAALPGSQQTQNYKRIAQID
jgi:hypothetical protein